MEYKPVPRCKSLNYPFGEPPILRCVLHEGHDTGLETCSHMYNFDDFVVRADSADDIVTNRKEIMGE